MRKNTNGDRGSLFGGGREGSITAYIYLSLAVLLLMAVVTVTVVCMTAGGSVPAGTIPSGVVDGTGDNSQTVTDPSDNGASAKPNNAPSLKSWVNAEASATAYRASVPSDVGRLDGIVSENAILIDLNSNTVMAQKAADEKVQIASMTKVMTLIVACDLIGSEDDMYRRGEIKQSYFDVLSGYQKAFTIGNKPYVVDMLYALILNSGCDAALALGETLAGSEAAFVALMNEKAAALGMTATTFTNCYGNDDGGRNISSVRDTAIMFEYALKNQFCKAVLTCPKWQYVGTGYRDMFAVSLVHNGFADAKYKDTGIVTVQGGKSGNDDLAGYCLVSYGDTVSGGSYLVVTARNTAVKTSYADSAYIYKNYIK